MDCTQSEEDLAILAEHYWNVLAGVTYHLETIGQYDRRRSERARHAEHSLLQLQVEMGREAFDEATFSAQRHWIDEFAKLEEFRSKLGNCRACGEKLSYIGIEKELAGLELCYNCDQRRRSGGDTSADDILIL